VHFVSKGFVDVFILYHGEYRVDQHGETVARWRAKGEAFVGRAEKWSASTSSHLLGSFGSISAAMGWMFRGQNQISRSIM
jgi:hypothetical protein